MKFFDEAALRLKQQLKVTENKEVAKALGMTANAWAMRKRRGVFPEMELRALAQQRPELGVDVEYVLTGEKLTPEQRLKQEKWRAEIPAKPPGDEETPDIFETFFAAEAYRDALHNKRTPIYKEIISTLDDCSDETVRLVLTLATKLRRADEAEDAEAEELLHEDAQVERLWRSIRATKRKRNGPPLG